MTAIEAVRNQYESFPYPPRDPAAETKHLHMTQVGQLSLASYVLWGGRRRPGPGFRVLDAGCGTGDNALFLAEQLRGIEAEVVAIDLSGASLDTARRRAAARGIEGIQFINGSLLDLPHMGLEPFDYIVSAGVLHHLPSPEEGLAALKAVLAPHGGLGIMVYGLHGRAAIYQLQQLFRIIAPPSLQAEERLRIVRETLSGLRPDHWAMLGRNAWAGEVDLHGDAGRYDLFLHSTDRAYTVPEIHEWAAGAGLRVIRMAIPGLYDPETYGLRGGMAGASEAARQAAAELLHGRMQKHTFFAGGADAGQAPPRADDKDAVPTWLNFDGNGVIARQLETQRELQLEHEGLRFQLVLEPFRRALLRQIDGRTPLGAILGRLEAKFPKMSAEQIRAQWVELHDGLCAFNLVGMFPGPEAGRRPGS